jgi:sugar lactone lactonase YvrE
MNLFDPRPCALGEGPLWHPERQQLFWFDILGKRLLSRDRGGALEWQFDEHVSAAGWVDQDTLLMASESGLYRFDINSGNRSLVVALEADNAATRSNDGRADPWGGFWIGTMGKQAQAGQGAIYRFYQGKVTRLFGDITISNAICFAPDRSCAYFTDTVTGRIMRQALSSEQGWPLGEPELFVDLTSAGQNQAGLNPDGAVVDSKGCLWSAQWGASRVARYGPDGGFLSAVDCPAEQVSCPAFGGADLRTLFVTSAAVGLNGEPHGRTWKAVQPVAGQREHQVLL